MCLTVGPILTQVVAVDTAPMGVVPPLTLQATTPVVQATIKPGLYLHTIAAHSFRFKWIHEFTYLLFLQDIASSGWQHLHFVFWVLHSYQGSSEWVTGSTSESRSPFCCGGLNVLGVLAINIIGIIIHCKCHCHTKDRLHHD